MSFPMLVIPEICDLGKLTSGKLTSGKLASGKLASGKLASGKLASGKPSSGKLAYDKLKTPSVKKVESPTSDSNYPTIDEGKGLGTKSSGGGEGSNGDGGGVDGSFVLNVFFDFDPVTGMEIDPSVQAFSAEVQGNEWTPEDALEWISVNPSGIPTHESSQTVSKYIYEGQYSQIEDVKMDGKSIDGRVLSSQIHTLAIPNESYSGDEIQFLPDTPGVTISIEKMIYLPE